MTVMDVSGFDALVGGVQSAPALVDWAAVTAWLGGGGPAAYQEMVSRFGPLDIGDWVWVYAPVSVAGMDFDVTLRGIVASARGLCQEYAAAPPPFHPRPGGLLPFGSTRGGDGLFWDTTGADVQRWPVVVAAAPPLMGPTNRGRPGPWTHTGLPFLEFLTALVTSGVPLVDGRRLGPLPPRAVGAHHRAVTRPWTPPAALAVPPGRRAALTEGAGLDALRALVPPPVGREPTVLDVEQVRRVVGTALPQEHLDLFGCYGPGLWGDWLRMRDILDPGADGLRARAEVASDSYRLLREAFPQEYAMATWPEPGGFLCIADSIDGDELGWLTEGPPYRWRLVWVPSAGTAQPPLNAGLVEVLLAWLRGSPLDEVFPRPDPERDVLACATFRPFGPA